MLKRLFHRTLAIALFGLGLFIVLKGNAYAQGALGNDWAQFLRDALPTFSNVDSATGEELAMQFIHNGIRIVKYIVGAV
ncbi:MAG: hypothetical protein V1760_02175, partial [Candidatus Peregrinibacteria bacterium]